MTSDKITKSDFQRVQNAKRKEPLVHKILCKTCGWCNDPTRIHKRENEKYYRCLKCGAELKSNKDDFKDKLMIIMKGGK